MIIRQASSRKSGHRRHGEIAIRLLIR